MERKFRKVSTIGTFNVLINVSNHPSDQWDEVQKNGWHEIVDIQFPNVSTFASIQQLEDMADEILKKILKIYSEFEHTYRNRFDVLIACHVAGEYTLAYILTYKLLQNKIPIAVACSDRIVTEDGKETHQFKNWRVFELM